jgi:LysM repeat protein
MRARTRAVFIAVNVIVSAAVVLTALFIWERTRTSTPANPTPTPGSSAPAETIDSPTALSVASPTAGPNVQSEASPEPLSYTVQEGDTLGAIALDYGVRLEDLMSANGIVDPNVLHVGQTLIIPGALSAAPAAAPPADTAAEPAPTAVSLPTPLATLTPVGPSLIEIAQVLGSGDLAAEVVVLRNRGGGTSLEKWTLSDAESNAFTFPALTLYTDAQVRVHSAAGSSTPRDLYWGRAAPAWASGTLITLRDAAGHVVDTYVVP